MNALITGISGYTGSHLAEYLLKEGVNVYGTIRGSCRRLDFLQNIIKDITLVECELTDINSIEYSLEDSQPDLIFHLGAQSFVPTSWRAPQETINSNILGTVNLLESIRKSQMNPQILMVGSSEEYGMVYPEEVPIKEKNPLRPLSPYGVTKVAQDMLGYQYFRSYGMKIVRVRPFNIIGPRSGREIVSTAFAKQLIDIERKLQKKVYVGNLNAIRDFNDVRDICKSYLIALQKCKSGEVYNISTGIGITIKELLSQLIILSKLKEVEYTVDESRLRPSDVELLIGDSSKFRDITGWKPEIPLVKSLNDTLEYWRVHEY